MKKRIYALILMFVLVFTSLSFAHSGRTDANGGHRDNKNKSGLGSYHYHCGGYPAHLHNNGICPYSSNASTAIKSSSNTNTTKKVVSASKQQAVPGKRVDIIINGSTLSEAYAIQEAGRTLVALRPIFDALDVSLHWDSGTQTAIGQKGNDIVQLTIGNSTAKINNETINLDVPGKIKNGKTLVPARFIAESLGATVSFDSSNNAVVISTDY